MQRLSAHDLRHRRAEIVAAVRAVAPPKVVYGGGTGSHELSSAEAAVTEMTAGSGLYPPGLFDHYRAFPATARRVLRAVGHTQTRAEGRQSFEIVQCSVSILNHRSTSIAKCAKIKAMSSAVCS